MEVDWAIMHCLTFSFDYGRIRCGIVLISFCPTSQDSFLSSVAFIFYHHLVLTVGESDHCKEHSAHPRAWMGSVEADPCVKMRCSCSLKHFHSMSLMKPSFVILEYASDIREEKKSNDGTTWSLIFRPLTSLGTSC